MKSYNYSLLYDCYCKASDTYGFPTQKKIGENLEEEDLSILLHPLSQIIEYRHYAICGIVVEIKKFIHCEVCSKTNKNGHQPKNKNRICSRLS